MSKEYYNELQQKIPNGKSRLFFLALQMTHNGCKEWERLSVKRLTGFLGLGETAVRNRIKDLVDDGIIKYEPRENDSRIKIQFQPLVDLFRNFDPRTESDVFDQLYKNGFLPINTRSQGILSQDTTSARISEKKLWNTYDEYRNAVLSMSVSPFSEFFLEKELKKPGAISTINIYKYITRYRLKSNNQAIVGNLSRIKSLSEARTPLNHSEQACMFHIASKELLGKSNFRDVLFQSGFIFGSNSATYSEIMYALWNMHRDSFWSNRVRKTGKFRNFKSSVSSLIGEREKTEPEDRIKEFLQRQPDLDPTTEGLDFFNMHISHLPNPVQQNENTAETIPTEDIPAPDPDVPGSDEPPKTFWEILDETCNSPDYTGL